MLLFYRLEIISAAFYLMYFFLLLSYRFCCISSFLFSLWGKSSTTCLFVVGPSAVFSSPSHSSRASTLCNIVTEKQAADLAVLGNIRKAQQKIPQLFSLVQLTQYKKGQEECGEQPRGISMHWWQFWNSLFPHPHVIAKLKYNNTRTQTLRLNKIEIKQTKHCLVTLYIFIYINTFCNGYYLYWSPSCLGKS